LEKYPATRIKFSKGFIFANLPTTTEFEEQRSTFFQVTFNFSSFYASAHQHLFLRFLPLIGFPFHTSLSFSTFHVQVFQFVCSVQNWIAGSVGKFCFPFKEQGRLDDYMEMRESLELSNTTFKESVIAWASPDCLPW